MLEDCKRFYIYLCIALTVPVVILGSSLISNGVPDIPPSFVKTGTNICHFEGVNDKAFLLPIVLLILISAVGLGYTCYVVNTHNDTGDFHFMQNKSHFKFMLRSCFLLWIAAFIWVAESLAYEEIMEAPAKYAIDLIEALQGIYVITIFVLNKYVRKEINNVIHKKKIKTQEENQCRDLLRTLNSSTERPANDNTRSSDM